MPFHELFCYATATGLEDFTRLHGPTIAIFTSMLPKLRAFTLALLLACFIAAANAAPNPKITNYQVADGQLLVTIVDQLGERQAVAEGSGMSSMVGETQALIVGGGYAIIYKAPGNAKGGYEGETQSVKHFDIYGTKKTLLDKPIRVNRIREVRTTKGYPLYVVSMSDGGAGIPYVYLVDKMKGEIWGRGAARMTGARNGKLIVAIYPGGEESAYPETKPIGTVYLDLDQMVDNMLRPGE